MVDLTNGHLAILTPYFILHSADLQYSKFERIHLTLDSKIVDDPKQLIAFSKKNNNFISIAFATANDTAPAKSTVHQYVMIEFDLQSPEVLVESNLSLPYFKMHENNIFIAEPGKNQGASVNHIGYQFIDAYVEIKGNIVEAK